MKNKIEDLNPIAWYEGLQLMPQHFQVNDLRVDGLYKYFINKITVNHWGFDHLEIDENLFHNGVLSIVNLSSSFSDGLIFKWNAEFDGPLSIKLTDSANEIIYSLCIPKNSYYLNNELVERWTVSPGEPVVDIFNSDDAGVVISKMIPNVKLTIYDPADKIHHHIPFLTVIKRQDKFLKVDYHPPSSSLFDVCVLKTNLIALSEKIRLKASMIFNSLKSNNSLELKDFKNQWIYSLLTKDLYLFEHRLHSKGSHPQDIFEILLSIAGALIPLSKNKLSNNFFYEHLDISKSFNVVINQIGQVVDEIRINVDPYTLHPFSVLNGDWSIRLEHPSLLEGSILLEISTEGSIGVSLLSHWLNNTLICFAEEKAKCLDLRVKGFHRNLLSAPPPNYQFDLKNKLFFMVTIDSASIVDADGHSLIIEGPNKNLGLSIDSIHLIRAHAAA
jgi:type VI secretion system protein ImpJ